MSNAPQIAALIGAELARCNVNATSTYEHERVVIRWDGNGLPTPRYSFLTEKTARELLSELLLLPDGAQKDAEQAVWS